MNRFPPFEGIRYGIRVFAEQSGHKVNWQKGMKVFADGIIRNSGEDLSNTGLIQTATLGWEMVHYGLSHKVVNVTKNLVRMLLASDMKIPRKALTVPFNIFELCPEEGSNIPSALVVYSPTDLESVNFRKMLERVGFGTNILQKQFANTLIIFFRDFNLQKNQAVLKIFDGQEDLPISDVIENWTWGNEPEVLRPTVLALVRFAFATICYLNIENPDSIVWKNHSRPSLGDVKPDSILLGENFKTPMGHHLRSGHFRELRHERFHRDEKGAARLVWIRPCEVGKEQDPAEPEPNIIQLDRRNS